MKEKFEAACPLCDKPASYILTDSANYKLYECSKCGVFEISNRADELVRDMTSERRAFYASLAVSAPEKKILELSFEVLPNANSVNHRYISVR
ncbi:hypothetical protein [Serratia fonticola]|uniref:hypothetical protein n=1 Tax=Serratia fonticola TaxID=47917 RepID=UPI00217AFA41|nr:hypothetical protein [Serratia fonticola]CAI1011666.1 Uncharacterised protein [Serratia fonticola]